MNITVKFFSVLESIIHGLQSCRVFRRSQHWKRHWGDVVLPFLALQQPAFRSGFGGHRERREKPISLWPVHHVPVHIHNHRHRRSVHSLYIYTTGQTFGPTFRFLKNDMLLFFKNKKTLEILKCNRLAFSGL